MLHDELLANAVLGVLDAAADLPTLPSAAASRPRICTGGAPEALSRPRGGEDNNNNISWMSATGSVCFYKHTRMGARGGGTEKKGGGDKTWRLDLGLWDSETAAPIQ